MTLPWNARSAAKRALRSMVRTLSSPTNDLPLGHWKLTRDPSGVLHLDGVALAALLEKYGSPLHVVDAQRLTDNARRFRAVPANASRGCEVFFSYKSGPVPGVLETLHCHGIGAQTQSPWELWLSQRLGLSAHRVIYDAPAKTELSIKSAIELGVELIVLNSREEISTTAAVARALGKRVRIGIRVAVPQTAAGHFGERIDTGAALAAFSEAMQRPELDVVAVHAHLGHEIATAEVLEAFAGELISFAGTLRDELSLELQIIDFGGGLASPTVTPRSRVQQRLTQALGKQALLREPGEVLSIEEYVSRVLSKVEKAWHDARRSPPRVFLEPGRALVANASMLLAKAVAVREPDESGLTTVVLDAGTHVARPLVDEHHQLFALHEPNGSERFMHRLVGPSGLPGDILYPGCELPPLHIGDAVALMDSGAYFVSQSSTFCSPRPGVVMLDQGKARLLRRPETFEDLIALDTVEGEPERDPYGSLHSQH